MLSSQGISKRMQEIRRWIQRGDLPNQTRPSQVDLTLLTDLNKLHDHIADIEALQTVHERPFVSNNPLLGRFIVGMRSAWNWMSTKWYVLPLVQQQNNFNIHTVQTWNTLLAYLKNVIFFATSVHARLAHVEEQLAKTIALQTTARESSVVCTPTAVENIVEVAVSGWRDIFATGPVIVLSSGRGEIVQALAAQSVDVYGVQVDATIAQQCRDVKVVCATDIEHLATLSDNTVGGIAAVWHAPLSVQDSAGLFDQCRRVLRVGSWAVWIWPWSARCTDTNAQMARDLALGMGFRHVRLDAEQHANAAFHTLSFRK